MVQEAFTHHAGTTSGNVYTGSELFPSDCKTNHEIYASARAREEFGWLIDKVPEWAGCNIDFITDLDITGGIAPSLLDDMALEEEIRAFVDKNPAIFENFTQKSLGYFMSSAKHFIRHGADGAQSFAVEDLDTSRNLLMIQSLHTRNFSEVTERSVGCSMQIPAFDDAAMTIMHECGHLLKQHSHITPTQSAQNETEAESLMVKSFVQSINERRNLDPQSLHTRLAFRSLQSLLWNGQRDITQINDPLGSEEGFSHCISAGLHLTDNGKVTHEQTAALLKAPIQINTMVNWLSQNGIHDRRTYFSALSALHSEGHFGENTLAEIYVNQALDVCETQAEEWLDDDLISKFRTKLGEIPPPVALWDHTDKFFKPRQTHYKYVDFSPQFL